MPCEICGSERGPFSNKVVEGATLRVCSACAMKKTTSESSTGTFPGFTPVSFSTKKLVVTPSNKPMSEGFEVVPKLGELIKQKREKNNWTHQELAMRLKIKESFLLKIEHGQLVPDDATLNLIEKVLEIKTRIPISVEEAPKPVSNNSAKFDPYAEPPKMSMTLEDILNAQLKKKKK